VHSHVYTILADAHALSGYIYGLRSPSVVVQLTVTLTREQADRITQVNALMASVLPTAAAPAESLWQGVGPRQMAVTCMMYWTAALQRAAGQTIFETGKIIGSGSAGEGRFQVAIPVAEHGQASLGLALGWIVDVLNAAWAGSTVPEQRGRLPAVMKQLKHAAALGSNVPHFLRGAFSLNIPFSIVAGRVYQFGQGSRARWLDSSFTDETPQISAGLARSKQLTAVALRRAGLPVPQHVVVSKVEDALRVAKNLGYPVVIKPADQDGGLGVAAGLKTPQDVKNVFPLARKHSRRILVEKHFEGRDYRLTVFHGKIIRAIERIPGSVNGDGIHSIRELVEQLNRDPHRGDGAHSPLKRLSFDDEALQLLGDEGLTPDSIPAARKFVRLRRTANITRGGTPVVVFDQVHPDNRLLAIRAAAILRLDLAGVDLLIPDIRRSWMETGAIICEVNGQPTLGQVTTANLYVKILRNLVTGDGRIPIVVVLGDAADSELATRIGLKMSEAGFQQGRADLSGTYIGETCVAKGSGAFVGGQMLLADRSVEVVVLNVNDIQILRKGLPFDRFDVLVVAGSFIRLPTKMQPQAEVGAKSLMHDLLKALLPACLGDIYLLPGAETGALMERAVPKERVHHLNEDIEGAAAVICAALVEADAGHRSSNGVSGS
jgi:cyanophycin synthetase